MSKKEVDPLEIEVPQNLNKTPEELVKLMTETEYEFHECNQRLKKLEKDKMLAEAKTSIILHGHRADLLQNITLREHFIKCEADSKFRLTVDLTASFVYLEHQELMEQYNYYSKRAKQLEKEYSMLQGILMNYQSENKLRASELLNKL